MACLHLAVLEEQRKAAVEEGGNLAAGLAGAVVADEKTEVVTGAHKDLLLPFLPGAIAAAENTELDLDGWRHCAVEDHSGKGRSLARGPRAALVEAPAVALRVERPEIF